VKKGKKLSEFDVQEYILERFAEEGVTSGSHGPIVAANAHAADPHFERPKKARDFQKRRPHSFGYLGKLDQPDGIYYDITWCGLAGEKAERGLCETFCPVVKARDAALQFIRDAFRRPAVSYAAMKVDQVCRDVIASGGYEKFFTHRTGHSIGTEVHGEGANIDSIETLDDRALLPSTCFSIEPGNLRQSDRRAKRDQRLHHPRRQVEVFGAIQRELLTMPR